MEACAIYGNNRNHPGFQYGNPAGSATPAGLFQNRNPGSNPNQSRNMKPPNFMNPQVPYQNQYFAPPLNQVAPVTQAQSSDPMMLKFLESQNETNQLLRQLLQNQALNKDKNSFPAQPVQNPKGILRRPEQVNAFY